MLLSPVCHDDSVAAWLAEERGETFLLLVCSCDKVAAAKYRYLFFLSLSYRQLITPPHH